MTSQMPPGSQIAFTRSWLERQGIEAQTIDVEGQIDPSLSYEENIKLLKRQFKLGGGRSRQPAARGLSAAECDVAIGNYEAGYNGEVMRDACACGHPDACVDLERKGREARKAAAPMGLGGGGIPPIPGVEPPALAPAAAPKRKKTAAKPAAKPKVKAGAPPAKKPKKTAAAKPKNGKKTAPELTAKQRKHLAETGSVMVRRGGKFVTVRG